MSPYLKITFRTFTIWILTSVINGTLWAFYISFSKDVFGNLAGDALLIFSASLFFSAPGFFIFWIILLIKLGNGTYERALFRAALSTGFILAVLFGLIGLVIFGPQFLPDKYVGILFPVVSAITSIMIHFSYFKKINN